MKIENPIVLIVDDSENDALLMRTVFERAGFLPPIQFARDGIEAIEYLRGDGIYRDRLAYPLPTVMLLDLNMPRKNGFEVLSWIREQPALRRLCVHVLSASDLPADIRRAYDLGANSYMVKPRNLDGLTHLAKTLLAWLNLNHVASLTEVGRDDRVVGRFLSAGNIVAEKPAHGASPAENTGASTAPFQELNGEAVHLYDARHDQRLERQAKEIGALRAEMEKFGRSVAHDLRSPLMAIGGYADLLADRCGAQLDENGHHYIDKINASAEQLERLLVTLIADAKERSRAPFPLDERSPEKRSA